MRRRWRRRSGAGLRSGRAPRESARGRTARQFLAAVLVIPALISVLWMTALGGTAITQYLGGFTGAVIGDNAPRFRTYVVEQRVPSYTYAEPITVGTVLPQQGVVYREVPAELGERASGYRYTVVNNRTVLVEPQTRRVVQIIE